MAMGIDLDYQEEIVLPSCSEYFWNAGDPLGQLSVYQYIVIINSMESYNYL